MISWVISACLVVFISNLFRQLFPGPKSEPPVVFHWLPFLGSTIEYGIDPYDFFTRCRKQVGLNMIICVDVSNSIIRAVW